MESVLRRRPLVLLSSPGLTDFFRGGFEVPKKPLLAAAPLALEPFSARFFVPGPDGQCLHEKPGQFKKKRPAPMWTLDSKGNPFSDAGGTGSVDPKEIRQCPRGFLRPSW